MNQVTLFKYLFILILPSVLVSFAANSVVFIIASLIAILQPRMNYSANFFPRYILFSSFILSIVIALILDLYNQNEFDSRQITKRLAFVFMPILICYSSKIHQRLALKVLVFFMSLLSSALILIGIIRSWLHKGDILYGNWDSDTTEKFYSNEMILNWGELSYKRIFLFLDAHPSYYAFFSATVILLLLFSTILVLKKWQRIGLLILHSGMILLVSSKAGILSLLLITAIEFFYRKSPKQILLGICVFALIIVSALSIPSTRLRIESIYEKITQKNKTLNNKDMGRLLLWTSLSEFNPEELVTGIGIQTSREKIKNLTGEDKNMHNQFLQSLISSGVLGLALLFCFLILPVFYCKQRFTYAFIALLFINLLLENMMDRVWGIMIISFFYALFVFGDRSLFNESSNHELKKTSN